MSTPEGTTGITPLSQLFTYHIFGMPDDVPRFERNPDAYVLRVAGLVDDPLELSLSDLRGAFESVTREVVLQCMTNVHWGRIRVTGARLLDVMERAGIADAATKIALRSADGFASNLRIDEVRDQPDAFLLAYDMNDETIPPEHGFPVRMASDGKYGYKWPKWLCEIELVDYDFKGHYEGRRGWSDAGIRGRSVT